MVSSVLATLCLMQLRTPLAFLIQGSTAGHIQFEVYQDSRVLFCRAAFQLGDLLHELRHGGTVSRCKNALVEQHDVPFSPFLQPAKVPLDSSTTLWCIIHFFLFCPLQLAEGMLCPKIQVIKKMNEQDRNQVCSLGYITNYLPPGRLCATNHSIMSLAVQPVLNPPHHFVKDPFTEGSLGLN